MTVEEFRRDRQFRDLQEKPVYRGPGREYGLPGTRLRAINTPSIAAVNGVAVGYGCDLALSCNMRIASDKARFGEFFGRLGVIPEEALQLLPRLVSMCKAYEIILTTDLVGAEEAGKIGLVNKVVPHEELMNATMELATKIATKSPLANALVCEGIRRGYYQSEREARQWTNLAFQFLQGSGDWLEASKAFAEGREPQFKGT
jgi:enoyl-CoA hydratase/carnithine racemase